MAQHKSKTRRDSNRKSKSKTKTQAKSKTRKRSTSKNTSVIDHGDHVHKAPIEFRRENCAPRAGSTRAGHFTCYNEKTLDTMKRLWNARHPDCAIETTTPHGIWRELKHYMGETCKMESCWLRQQFMKRSFDPSIMSYTFAPQAPRQWRHSPTEWLSSLDIMAVMKQYEAKYPCFSFIGPSPIDYDTHMVDGECVWEELCEFSLEKHLNKKKRKIGIVFNIDPHYKEGSHWVALFIDAKREKICFFDSYGEDPEPQIMKFMKTVQKQSNELNKNGEYKICTNTKRHQYSDSECGMYCLYFIIELLKDTTSLAKLYGSRIPDKDMIALRKKYFNH